MLLNIRVNITYVVRPSERALISTLNLVQTQEEGTYVIHHSNRTKIPLRISCYKRVYMSNIIRNVNAFQSLNVDQTNIAYLIYNID